MQLNRASITLVAAALRFTIGIRVLGIGGSEVFLDSFRDHSKPTAYIPKDRTLLYDNVRNIRP